MREAILMYSVLPSPRPSWDCVSVGKLEQHNPEIMMTIAYNKIYQNLDTQWKYARLYLAIQFFDPDSLLPPPFTFLTLIMYMVRAVAKARCLNTARGPIVCKRFRPCAAIDIEYRWLECEKLGGYN